MAVNIAKAKVFENRDLSQEEVNSIVFVNGQNGQRRPKKGDYGYVYQVDDSFYIAINFQIRFR